MSDEQRMALVAEFRDLVAVCEGGPSIIREAERDLLRRVLSVLEADEEREGFDLLDIQQTAAIREAIAALKGGSVSPVDATRAEVR